MGVCASSSSHIVKASWGCLVGRNGDVKPKNGEKRNRAEEGSGPLSFMSAHALTEATHESAEGTGSQQVIVRKEPLESSPTTLISHPSRESSNVSKVSVNLYCYCAHIFKDRTLAQYRS